MTRVSPLEPVLTQYGDQIPLAFHDQFLLSPGHPYGVTLDGVMHRIWHKSPSLRPLFWILGKLRILVPYPGHDIPTSLVVLAGYDSTGQPYHQWKRTFCFNPPVSFNSTVVYDPAVDKVVELVGPRGFLAMAWNVRFTAPGTLRLDTYGWGLRLGRRTFWLPRALGSWVFGIVHFIQSAETANSESVQIELVVSHALFGKMFGYTGWFRVLRTTH
ncbi:MAG: DUF4166 domain-containing protein [Nitrospirota bacterium]